MLEHVPQWLGQMMRNVRAGHSKLAVVKLAGEVVPGADGFALTSPAFAHGGSLDPRFTADAEAPTSPPLAWTAPPAGTRSLALIVEDPDAPSPQPFVHFLGWNFAGEAAELAAGAEAPRMGRNSYQQSQWLPPDPPAGHGPHDYVFQLFALDKQLEVAPGSGRDALMDAMEGDVIGAAVLSATYERHA